MILLLLPKNDSHNMATLTNCPSKLILRIPKWAIKPNTSVLFETPLELDLELDLLPHNASIKNLGSQDSALWFGKSPFGQTE